MLHPDYDARSFRGTLATEAEGPLDAFSETTALRAELSRLREQYRKLSDSSEDLGRLGPTCCSECPESQYS